MTHPGIFILAAALPLSAQAQQAPIIDMHLHALGANAQGPGPVAVCAPFLRFPGWDQRRPYPEAYTDMANDPSCNEPIWSPATDEELRRETIEVVERLNVFGVLSGTTRRVQEWRDAAPGRFLAGLGFSLSASAPSPDSLRTLVQNGALEVLAEIGNQYLGIEPADPRMEPYWSLAEELDVPVGIHMGPGPPGGIYLGQVNYRARLSSALLLEDVLVRHPRLRVYVMHAGYPLLDDMLALLYAHPQVYVEVGVMVYTRPRADFYRYLQAMLDAGFEDRIMFGSDHMVWPEAIEHAVRVIDEAPDLDGSQKRAILYDNAARFLRLSEEEMDRHWGGG